MTIDKIGGGSPPKSAGITDSKPVEGARENEAPAATSFKEIMASSGAQPGQAASGAVAAAIQQAARELQAGQITKEQAVDHILASLRDEIAASTLKPEQIDSALAFVRETITDDPLIESLLSAK